MWLAIHNGAITLGVSLHKEMTKQELSKENLSDP